MAKGLLGFGSLAFQAQGGSAQLEGLRVEDVRLVLRRQTFAAAQQTRSAGFPAERICCRRIDHEIFRFRASAHGRIGHRAIELGIGILEAPLVQEVHHAEVAELALHDGIPVHQLIGLGEQAFGLFIAAEIGLLQGFVRERLRPVPALAERGKIFGSLGVVARIVAAIGFGKGSLRARIAGLDSREGDGISGACEGHLNLARNDPVRDQASESKLQNRVIAGKPFAHVQAPALAFCVDAVANVLTLERAGLDLENTEGVDGRGC